jgi:two-component system invasion response regulator UvrY
MLGQHYISSDVAQKLALGKMAAQSDESPLKKLSPREMQIMMMIVQGQGNQQISDTLFLSPKTISTYRHRIYEKLGVGNDVELTRYAIRHNLIDPS